jgi:GcrA cell cycle regulator
MNWCALMGTLNSDWPPDRIEKLKALFADGLSFSQIASELAITRNSAIAKANRLGLKRDLPARKPFVHQVKRRRDTRIKNPGIVGRSRAENLQTPKVFHPENNPPDDPADQDIPRRQRKTILTLGPKHCKFPVGDPREKGFFFCGAARQFPLPYCAAHVRRCFHPAKGRT